VIATKFSSSLFPGDPNAGGSSRKGIVGQCEESLRRLQTDYIDLYWLHVWDPLTPIEETMRALDDLVSAGKVRYVGVSDTPAWKVAEAQTIARFRGWPAFIALQIEYSLLERTVEGELVPMALEMGLGVTPWSPLKSGVLSGKYTREGAKDAKPGRGAWVAASLTDRSFAVLDVVRKVAGELGTTPARVALAWVQARPSVASTIIGARSVAQIDDNLGALGVSLPAEAIAALDEVSKPKLGFPADFVRASGTFKRGGTTVNGETGPAVAAGADHGRRATEPRRRSQGARPTGTSNQGPMECQLEELIGHLTLLDVRVYDSACSIDTCGRAYARCEPDAGDHAGRSQTVWKNDLVQAVFPGYEYVSLELPDERARALADPRGFMARLRSNVIIDEVQRAPDLLSYIQAAIDELPRPGRFVLTGSQNLLLMEGVAQTLAGRTAVLNLHPLALSELTRRVLIEPASLDAEPVPVEEPRHRLWETLWAGFYPRIHDQGLPPDRWLADYQRTYVERTCGTCCASWISMPSRGSAASPLPAPASSSTCPTWPPMPE